MLVRIIKNRKQRVKDWLMTLEPQVSDPYSSM